MRFDGTAGAWREDQASDMANFFTITANQTKAFKRQRNYAMVLIL
jgi:hypothetical protein